jgi:hypothetical protein
MDAQHFTLADLAAALKTVPTGQRDPKECEKVGHQWKTAVHQESYLCVQCNSPGFYDWERHEVTSNEKRAKASLEYKDLPPAKANSLKAKARA